MVIDSLLIHASIWMVVCLPVYIVYILGPMLCGMIWLLKPLHPVVTRVLIPFTVVYTHIQTFNTLILCSMIICLCWWCFYHNNNSTTDDDTRILMIGDSFLPTVDGISTFNMNVISTLVSRGYTVMGMTAVPGPSHLDGVPIYRSGVGPKVTGHTYHHLAFLTPGMVYQMWKFRPTVIHVWEISGILSIQMILLSALFGIPCVTSIHTLIIPYAGIFLPWTPEWVVKFVYMVYSHTILTIPKMNFTVYDQNRTKDIPLPTNVTFLPSGIDHETYHPQHRSVAFRTMYDDHPQDKTFILYVGRLTDEKNVLCLPTIFRRVHEKQKNIVFLVVGDGHRRKWLETMSDGLPVFYLGSKTQEELGTIYASCDIFFSPSISEAFGLVFVEAMASGLVVIGMNRAAVPTLFPPDYEFLCDKEDDIPDRINRAIINKNTESMETINHSKIYSWNHTVDVLLESYIIRNN